MSDLSKIFQKGKPLGNEYDYELIFNGKTVASKSGDINYYKNKHKERYYFNIYDRNLYNKISDYPIKSIIRPDIDYIYMTFDWYLADQFKFLYLTSVQFMPKEDTGIEDNLITFKFYIDIFNWKNVWSAKEHVDAFIGYIKEHQLNDIYDLDFFKPISDFEADSTNPGKTWFTVDLLGYPHYELPLKNIVNECLNAFVEANNRVLEKYQLSLTNHSLTECFNFPLEVKTACEQYLLYFAEFLNDIAGIEVNTSLNPDSDGESTIFSIQPKNKDEALETINQYLKAYLRFPGNELINNIQVASDLSLQAQSLKIQVDNLKNQLDIANLKRQMIGAVIELKDQTIQDKNSEISRLGQQLQENQITIRVMAESLQNKEDEEESILGDALRVKDYEAPGGLIVGTPEIVRKIKHFFGID